MKRNRVLGMALVVLAAACSETSSGPGGGTQVVLTDAPFPFDRVKRVDVHIVRIEATTSLDTMPGAPGWVTVVSPNTTFNLLDYQGGATALLGATDIAAGSYQAMRMTINTSLSSLTGIDDSNIPVTWPVNGELTMYAYIEGQGLAVGSGGRIVIDFDVGRSFQEMGGSMYFLAQGIRAVNDAATGSISGQVTMGDAAATAFPLANAVVTAYRNGPLGQGYVFSTARTNAQGNFTLAYLTQDSYWLRIEAPYTIEGQIESCLDLDSVIVLAGQQLTSNNRLPSFVGGCMGGDPPNPDSGGVDTTIVSPGGPVASVRIIFDRSNPTTSDSTWAAAILKDGDSTILSGRAVTWAVSDSSKVFLSQPLGPWINIRATAAGSYTITATSEGVSSSRVFTVTTGTGGGGGPGTGPVETVTLTVSNPGPAVNDSIGAFALLKNAAGQSLTGRPVTFSLSDTTVVRMMGAFGQSAVMRALKAGTSTLTATSEGKSATATITVH